MLPPGVGIPPAFRSLAENSRWETWARHPRPISLGFPTCRPKKISARWRCWEGIRHRSRGRLLVHLVSGMMFMLGLNEPPKRSSQRRHLRWKDGRNMPDVHATLFEYGEIPIYFRLNLGTESPENLSLQRLQGDSRSHRIRAQYYPQTGKDEGPSYYSLVFPRRARRVRHRRARPQARQKNPACKA